MARRVLVTRRLPHVAEDMLADSFSVVSNRENRALTPEELREKLRDCDAVLSTVSDALTAEVLESAGNLRAIANYASGLDNIDAEYAESRGIAVYNTPDAVTDSVADLTFALLLSLVRKIGGAREYVRAGAWTGWDPEIFLGTELRLKTIGIIGFGRIGRAVAKRASGFGMRILYYDPYLTPYRASMAISGIDAYWVSLSELQEKSDVVTLHVPLTEETRGLVGYDFLHSLPKKSVLINTSRGAVVDTNALVEALEQGLISGAALDVTDPEPLPATHRLTELPNCIVVPHIGTATAECRVRMAENAAERIIRHFEEIDR